MARPLTAMLATLAAICIASCEMLSESSIQTVPGPHVPIPSRVTNVDLLIDEQGTFHVVCECLVMHSTRSSAAGDHTEWWYLRGRNHGTGWDPPRVFASSSWHSHPQIAESGGALQILYLDRQLVELSSNDHGVTWSEPKPVLATESRRPLDFEVHSAGDSLALAFFVRREGRDTLELCYASWGGKGPAASCVLGTAPDDFHLPGVTLRPWAPCAPRLRVSGKSVIAIYPMNWSWEPAQLGTSVDSWIESFQSTDAGAHWAREASIVAGQRLSEGLSPLPMTRVEIAETQPPCLIIDAIPIMRAQRTATGWTTPVNALARSGVDHEPSRSVATCTFHGAPWAAWIDYRHRHRDWSAFGPFDIRWLFDNPEWCNNDVYVGVVPSHNARGLAAWPRRLTPNLSFASSLAMAPDGDRLVVMWSGRRRVGKYEGTEGSSLPEILWTTVRAH